MDIVKFNKTFTTKFILPLLFKQKTDYSELFNNYFINAYVGDIERNEYDDKIILTFSDYPSLTVTQKLIDTYDEYTTEDGLFALVYELPKEYTDDYFKFLLGKYNIFSDNAKFKIIDFWQCDNNTILYSILNGKTEKIKEYLTFKKSNHKINEDSPWFPPIIKYEIKGVM